MSINLRRWLYSAAILIFVIAAPALILYTAGYRFDFKKRKVQTTGSIFIKTIPSQTKIFINNKLISKTSPVRLNHLLPNKYDIKVEMPGYKKWEKSLEVIAGQTTFADQIMLWPENPTTEEIATGAIKNFRFNNNETKIIWQANKELYLYNILNKTSEKILTLPTDDEVNFDWSQNDERLIISQKKNYWLLTLKNKTLVEKFNTIDSQAEIIKFHSEINDLIIFLKNNRLYSYNLISKEIKKILNENIQDYRWHNGNWYYLTSEAPVMLTYTNLKNEKKSPPLFQLPEYDNYEFIDIINNQALVYQPDTLTLYIFNLDPEKFNNTSQIIKPVTSWNLNNQKNKILLNNDWEVWTFDLLTAKSEIINRVSDLIANAKWYTNNNHILIQHEKFVKITENDGRDQRNQKKLWDAKQIFQTFIASRGEDLYILYEFEPGQNKIIKLKIADFPLLNL